MFLAIVSKLIFTISKIVFKFVRIIVLTKNVFNTMFKI